MGALAPSVAASDRIARTSLPFVVLAALAAEAGDLMTKPPGIYIHPPAGLGLTPFMTVLGALIVVAAAACVRSPAFGRAHVVILVVTFLWLGGWVLKNSPTPWIDVYVFQRDGSAALLHGQNPYALTFPNIYGNGVYYGPGMVANGRVLFGYVYFPLSLLMVLPGAIFFNDVRYAQLAAVALVALSLGVGGRTKSRLGLSAAALLLLLPRGFFVLELAASFAVCARIIFRVEAICGDRGAGRSPFGARAESQRICDFRGKSGDFRPRRHAAVRAVEPA
jgi:hypothetical protein